MNSETILVLTTTISLKSGKKTASTKATWEAPLLVEDWGLAEESRHQVLGRIISSDKVTHNVKTNRTKPIPIEN
jgi:hypothetical protein